MVWRHVTQRLRNIPKAPASRSDPLAEPNHRSWSRSVRLPDNCLSPVRDQGPELKDATLVCASRWLPQVLKEAPYLDLEQGPESNAESHV